MRFIVQRVKEANVTVDGETLGKIGKGFLVFVGISASDVMDENHSMEKNHSMGKNYSHELADKMVKKLIGLRIFQDENGKTNLDLKAVEGQLLIVSQFTLYADCKKGNRPSFTKAGNPDMANEMYADCRKGNRPSFINAADPDAANQLYRYIIEKCRQEIAVVEEGSFGADMKVSLINDGPFTVILDSDEICH